MLTWGDDYPIHQTPEPIASSGTDRNFYDRYFFNGYAPDGATYFAMAFGVYPHLNIMDASFSVIVEGVQHSVHASRILHMERLDLQVGPLSLEVIKPLEVLRIKVDDPDNGIKADLVFTRRCLAVEEPRFQYRNGPRTILDYTRMTQNGVWSGTLEVRGTQIEITPGCWLGTRDRSWGVRPIGASDAQPMAPASDPQFYWVWVPVNFEDRVSFYHINARADGTAFNESAVISGRLEQEGGGTVPALQKMAACQSSLTFKSGTRHAKAAEIEMTDEAGGRSHLALAIEQNFYMAGLGYSHPEWGHGMFKGELDTGYESWDLKTLDENAFDRLHVQALATATLTLPDGSKRQGRGIVEQLIIGPHGPSGFTQMMDFAP